MNGVSQITCTEDVVLVTIRSREGEIGLIAGILDEFAKENIILDMISQTVPQGSVMDASFTVYGRQMVDALRVITRVRERYSQLQIMASTGNCKLQLYGEEMREISGVASAALLPLVRNQVDVVMITTSEVDISLVVPAAGCEKAMELMEETFGVSPRLM